MSQPSTPERTTTQFDFVDYRQQFPALANKRYFNYGGQGPMTRSTLDAIHQAHEHYQVLGPFSGAANQWIQEETHLTRSAIAQELGVDPNTITLTENVLIGCNIPLWGIDWQEGDHILMSDCEHPGVVAIVQELQRRFYIDVSTFPVLDTLNEGDPTERLEEHLQPRTRLVILSHVLWNTGQVLPLTEMVQRCHDRPQPILVLADAAQSVGMLPLNLAETGVDFYAFTGHKWCCGPAGLGGLYVNPQVELHPTFIGWRGIRLNATGTPIGWQANGQRFEVSTSDYSLCAGLRTAITHHQTWGSANDRYQRILHLSAYVWEKLGDIPHLKRLRTAPPESGLISFQLITSDQDQPKASQHQALAQALESKGFLVRTLMFPSCVRVCVHYFTLESEIDELVAQIQDYQV